MEWALIGLVSAAALFVLAKAFDVLAQIDERQKPQTQNSKPPIGFIQHKETKDDND